MSLYFCIGNDRVCMVQSPFASQTTGRQLLTFLFTDKLYRNSFNGLAINWLTMTDCVGVEIADYLINDRLQASLFGLCFRLHLSQHF